MHVARIIRLHKLSCTVQPSANPLRQARLALKTRPDGLSQRGWIYSAIALDTKAFAMNTLP